MRSCSCPRNWRPALERLPAAPPVGVRHFEDPDLMERYLELTPAPLAPGRKGVRK